MGYWALCKCGLEYGPPTLTEAINGYVECESCGQHNPIDDFTRKYLIDELLERIDNLEKKVDRLEKAAEAGASTQAAQPPDPPMEDHSSVETQHPSG